jgi:hypothetical protein
VFSFKWISNFYFLEAGRGKFKDGIDIQDVTANPNTDQTQNILELLGIWGRNV